MILGCPCVGHDGSEDGVAAVAFEAVAHLVVDLVAGHALEEELQVEVAVVCAKVDAVVEPGYAGAEVHAVVAVDDAVAVVVGVFGVAGMERRAFGGIAVQMVKSFLVGAVDAEVLSADGIIGIFLDCLACHCREVVFAYAAGVGEDVVYIIVIGAGHARRQKILFAFVVARYFVGIHETLVLCNAVVEAEARTECKVL